MQNRTGFHFRNAVREFGHFQYNRIVPYSYRIVPYSYRIRIVFVFVVRVILFYLNVARNKNGFEKKHNKLEHAVEFISDHTFSDVEHRVIIDTTHMEVVILFIRV